MNRLHVELVPVIGARLVGLGMSALFSGTHGLRRLAEGIVWGEPPRPCGKTSGCMQVHHHYRYHCQPRCYR